jgi:hypothetical protein
MGKKITPKKWRKTDPGCGSLNGEHAFEPGTPVHVKRAGGRVTVNDTCRRCGVKRTAVSAPGKRVTYKYLDVPHFRPE